MWSREACADLLVNHMHFTLCYKSSLVGKLSALIIHVRMHQDCHPYPWAWPPTLLSSVWGCSLLPLLFMWAPTEHALSLELPSVMSVLTFVSRHTFVVKPTLHFLSMMLKASRVGCYGLFILRDTLVGQMYKGLITGIWRFSCAWEDTVFSVEHICRILWQNIPTGKSACVWVFGFQGPWDFPALSPHQRLAEASLLQGCSLKQLMPIQHFHVAFVCLCLCQSHHKGLSFHLICFCLKPGQRSCRGSQSGKSDSRKDGQAILGSKHCCDFIKQCPGIFGSCISLLRNRGRGHRSKAFAVWKDYRLFF